MDRIGLDNLGNKICFAIYNRNQTGYSDNMIYICEQQPAEGIQMECLSVEDVEDKYAAYNEMMMVSDAKYKVYMDADTYIVNKNFVRDIIRIFQKDSSIGVIGVLGARILPTHEKKMCGKAIFDSIENGISIKNYSSLETGWEEVDTIEDVIIVTACDIPWNERVDECVRNEQHCLEVQRAGYKVVVAGQKEPWCLKETD